MSTDYFTNYNVKSVTVDICNNGTKTGTLTVTQGSTTIGTTSASFGQTWTYLTANTSTGSGGTLTLSYSVAQACGIHSITVVYTTGGGSGSDTYTVTYNANDGSANPSTFTDNNGGDGYAAGVIVAVLDNNPNDNNTPSFTKTGYSVSHWNTEADGSETSYNPDDDESNTISITGNVVLYAQWEINNYKITMPADDMYGSYSCNVDNINLVEYGTEVTLTYTHGTGFDGYTAIWTVNGEVITGNTFNMPAENVTVEVSVGLQSTFVFNTDAGLSALNITKPASGDGTDLYPAADYKITSNDAVIMNITHGSTNTRVWNSSGSTDLRVYNGGSLIFSVSEDYEITSIQFTGTTTFSEWTVTGSDPVTSVTFSADGTYKINTVTVNYAAISSVAKPVISPESGGTFVDSQTITITGPEGATIYYTTDGNDPTTGSSEYSEPFTSNATTIKAIAVINEESSSVATATYTRNYRITIEQPTGGVISASADQAAAGASITISCSPKVGFTFDAWSISPPVSIISNTFTMPANDVTISATLTTTEIRTVTFYIGDDDIMTAQFNAGIGLSISNFDVDVATEGYIFDGWYDEAVGGTKITGTYIPDNNVSIYAHFIEASYTLVTDVNSLQVGDLVVIAAAGYDVAMSTTQNTNNRGEASITKTGSTITWVENAVCEFELKAGNKSNTWAFYDTTAKGYLYAASSSSNNMRTKKDLDDNGSWAITIANNTTSVVAQGTNTRNIMRYNNSNNIFSCYSSGQNAVCLYRKPASSSKGVRGDIDAQITIIDIAESVTVTVNNNSVVSMTGKNYGNANNLIIEDGGQLYTESANVNATVHKTIAAWNTGLTGGWYFIASPINVNNLAPTNVMNMTVNSYDLYQLNNTSWENYKEHAGNANSGFNLANGRGYLYASEGGADLQFSGAVKAYDADHTISVSEGWNLIGNPYTFEAYPNQAYYTINAANSGITAQTSTSSAVVAPCTGIIVKAAEDGTVKFLKDAPETSANNGNLQMVLAHKVATRDGASVNKNIDNAIVSFNEGSQLEKFYFGNPSASIFIPQNGEDYAIAFSDRQGDVPLYFKANETGTYTISFAGDEMSLNGIYLIDILAEEEIDLSVNPSYTFIGSPADRMARFKIVFRNANGDGTSDIFAYQSGNDIVVSGEGELQIFDVMGRMVSRQRVNGVETVNAMPYGVYIFKLNGMTQKIVVR